MTEGFKVISREDLSRICALQVKAHEAKVEFDNYLNQMGLLHGLKKVTKFGIRGQIGKRSVCYMKGFKK